MTHNTTKPHHTTTTSHHTALVHLDNKEAGKGVRCIQEAAISRAHAATLGTSYDAAAPVTKAARRKQAESVGIGGWFCVVMSVSGVDGDRE